MHLNELVKLLKIYLLPKINLTVIDLYIAQMSDSP